jgi:hypothetical protein
MSADDKSEDNVVPFLRDHLDEFMRLTTKQAGERGHTMGQWHRYPMVLYAYCTECGAYAGIDWLDHQKASDHLEARGLKVLLDPVINFTTEKPNARGDALSERCPSPQAPWHPDHQGKLGAKESPARVSPATGSTAAISAIGTASTAEREVAGG